MIKVFHVSKHQSISTPKAKTIHRMIILHKFSFGIFLNCQKLRCFKRHLFVFLYQGLNLGTHGGCSSALPLRYIPSGTGILRQNNTVIFSLTKLMLNRKLIFADKCLYKVILIFPYSAITTKCFITESYQYFLQGLWLLNLSKLQRNSIALHNTLTKYFKSILNI